MIIWTPIFLVIEMSPNIFTMFYKGDIQTANMVSGYLFRIYYAN